MVHLELKKKNKSASRKFGVDFEPLSVQIRIQVFFVQIPLLSKMATLFELENKPKGFKHFKTSFRC